VDHRFRHELYFDRPGLSATTPAEYAADYFAACVLMPMRWLYRALAAGRQRVSDLSQLFAVSPQAMNRRLEHLSLTKLLDNASALAINKCRPMSASSVHPW
jgi:Zn-dependent peptidase ImmA (M78 family)